MSWIKAFVDRPIATILLTVAIIAAGVIGYTQLPVAALPQVDFPTIQISASLPGANPATMASAVATPIERQLATIAGIDQITSNSSTGATTITVQFNLSRNIDAAALDVQSALSAVARKLPIEMTTPPSFQKVNPSDQSILVLALRDPTLPLSTLQTIADTTIIPRLATLEGVAQIDVFGTRKFAVRIQFDPTKLSARGLTPEDVRAAVAAANSNTAVGLIGNGPRNYILDATGTLKHAADFLPIVVAYRDGLPVRLGDIATAVDSVENLRGAAKFNGNPGIAMGVKRQPGANVVAMADRVMALLPAIRDGLPPNTHLDVIVDRSQSVRNSVKDAQTTLVGTAALVVFVIFLVLGDARATVIPATATPGPTRTSPTRRPGRRIGPSRRHHQQPADDGERAGERRDRQRQGHEHDADQSPSPLVLRRGVQKRVRQPDFEQPQEAQAEREEEPGDPEIEPGVVRQLRGKAVGREEERTEDADAREDPDDRQAVRHRQGRRVAAVLRLPLLDEEVDRDRHHRPDARHHQRQQAAHRRRDHQRDDPLSGRLLDLADRLRPLDFLGLRRRLSAPSGATATATVALAGTTLNTAFGSVHRNGGRQLLASQTE